MTDLLQVGARFNIHGKPFSVTAYITGHIHKTYLLESGDRDKSCKYILQRLNTRVFRKPEAVQDNIERILSWLEENPGGEHTQQDLEMIRSVEGGYSHIDREGNHWRCFRFIENSVTLEKAENPEQAYEGSRSFGLFTARLGGYDPRRLHVTIPNFMDMDWRQKQLVYAELTNPGERLRQVQPELKRVKRLSEIPEKFIKIRQALPDRVTHNDTKITNVLFDAVTGKGICVIDLDTVMTGTLLTDFGDMVRSFTASGHEDDAGPGSADCREDLFEGLASGFSGAVTSFLDDIERSNLLLGAKAVIYMQAVRFLTDYLNGDAYYNTSYPEQNLQRARNQLGMLESLVEKQDLFQAILNNAF